MDTPMRITKPRLALIMTALTLCTCAMMGDTAVITAGNDIFMHFDGANVIVLNFILSGPALIQVIMGPIVGKLLERFSAKIVLLAGFGCFAVGGCCGALVDNVYYVAAMRALAGIGMGTVNVSSLTLIAQLFIDENRRATMVGIWNGGMSIIGAVIGFVAGALVMQGWTAVYRCYWIAIPIWIMVLLVVPRFAAAEQGEDDPGETAGQSEASAEQLAPTPWRTVALSLVAYFISMMVFCVMFYYASLYVAETGVGTAELAGTATAMISVGTLIGCVVFSPLYARAKRWLPTLFNLLLFLGYALLFAIHTPAVTVAACIVLGVVNALIMNHYQTRITVLASPKDQSFIIGLGAMILGGSMFLSTYFATLVQAIMGTTSLVAILPVLAAFGLVAAVLSVVVAVRSGSSSSESR